MATPFLHQLTLRNLLSFGPQTEPVHLCLTLTSF